MISIKPYDGVPLILANTHARAHIPEEMRVYAKVKNYRACVRALIHLC